MAGRRQTPTPIELAGIGIGSRFAEDRRLPRQPSTFGLEANPVVVA